MPLAVKHEAYTTHDLVNFPDDGKRREVIRGELIVSATPSTRHQRTVMELSGRIWLHLRAHPGGLVMTAPTEVVFDEMDSVQPDIVFLAEEHLSLMTERRIQGAPDWVVEVLSPSNRGYDLETKRKLYARYGVVYWALDLENETIFVWDEGGYTVYRAGEEAGVSVLPGFHLNIGEFFAAL